MKTFIINGKTYTAKEFDFNSLCLFQDNGIDLSEFDSKSLLAVRCYLADCGNITPKKAGEELNAHIVGGGNFDDIFKLFAESIENSDFFRAISKTEEKAPTKSREKKPAESKEE